MTPFSRRMAPAALLAGLVVAAGPPLVYLQVAAARGRARAEDLAGRLAAEVAAVARRQPRLWPYHAPKVVAIAASWAGPAGASAVAVTDCRGRPLYGSGEQVAAWAPVRTARGLVGWVGVGSRDAGDRAALAALAGASGAAGLLIGLVVFWLPAAVVRRQAARIAEGRAVLRGQEEERARVARDLHDGLGQGLTALRLSVEGGRTREALDAADEALAELRRVVADLRPADIEAAGGLSEALRACTERFERRSGLPVSFRPPAEGAPAASDDVASHLLRMLQEALANAARHAGATELGVRLDYAGGAWVLTVADNGVGMAGDGGGMGDGGLRTIRERAAFLDGRVEVEAPEGGGTAVRVTLPG